MKQTSRYLWVLLAACLIPAQGWCVMGKNMPGMFIEPKAADGTPLPPPAKGAPAAKTPKGDPIVIEAKEMGYDKENGIVIARGDVEVAQGSTVVMADQITYFQQSDYVVAEGHVSLLQPTGDVVFSDRMELSNELKTGVITAFKSRLSDDSVFVASQAHKVSAAVTTLNDAQYTPCHICADMAPFWQLNADDVKIDKLEEEVSYHDATLDLYGVPVFYTPYFSHPTPDAEAKSGILPGQYSTNGNLGTIVKVPYYWRISDDKDVVVTPWYTTTNGPLLQANYRQLTDHGEYSVQASGTDPHKIDALGNQEDGYAFRGHLFAKGEEHLDDQTSVGFDIQRTTDDTYLRLYSLGDQPSLFSRLFIETAQGRNFASLQTIAIQGLRATDNSRTTPLVLPYVQSYYETTPDENNIRYHVSGDAQSLTRDEGVDQRRLSFTVGASHPYVSDTGVVMTTTVNLRQDIYQTDNIVVDGSSEDADTYRTLPQAAFEWKYPLVNSFGRDAMTIEPIMMAVLQANGGNPVTISNEDSRLLELSDTNLFSIDRGAGLDLVDSGSRLAYGARTQYLFGDGTSLEGLLGQNYSVTGNTPFPNTVTPGESFSDYIGRVAYNIAPFTVTYRFALDNDSFASNREEFSVGFTKPWLTVVASYDAIDKSTYLDDSKEGQLSVTLPLGDNVSVYGGARRDFDLNEFVSASSGIVYKNECFNIGLDAVRNFTRDRDVEPTTQVLLHVALKNLGEFGGR